MMDSEMMCSTSICTCIAYIWSEQTKQKKDETVVSTSTG